MKIQKSFSLSLTTIDKLTKLSAQQKRSLSQIVDIAINQYYKETVKQLNKSELKKEFKTIIEQIKK